MSAEADVRPPSGNGPEDRGCEELDLPDNVRLVIDQRLDRLGETAGRLLTAAAVIGRHCDLRVLEAMVDVVGDELLDAVDEAELARLTFTDRMGRETHLWFAHELIRQTLLARLSTVRRQRYHLRAADALERVHADELELRAADIAHHLWEAGPAADHQPHRLDPPGDVGDRPRDDQRLDD
jgi:predicted ATPase